MLKGLNKRGQGLSTNAIILIVLGVIILVMLILGFTLGWSNLKEYISPSNNVDKVVQACQAACATGSTYSYCTEERELKAPDLGNLASKGTCNDFSTKAYEKYGIGACPGLCPASSEDGKESDGDAQNANTH